MCCNCKVHTMARIASQLCPPHKTTQEYATTQRRKHGTCHMRIHEHLQTTLSTTKERTVKRMDGNKQEARKLDNKNKNHGREGGRAEDTQVESCAHLARASHQALWRQGLWGTATCPRSCGSSAALSRGCPWEALVCTLPGAQTPCSWLSEASPQSSSSRRWR